MAEEAKHERTDAVAVGDGVTGGLVPAARYTDGAYMDANPTWHAEDAPWKFAEILKILKAANLAPKTICEVGCGTGAVLDLLQGHFVGSLADGYEFSPQVFALCQARHRAGLDFFNSSAFDATKTYDLSMAIDVIEHVEDPFSFARGLGKIGQFQLFHIPLEMNIVALAREWPILQARKEVGHLHYFTRRTATALLEDCGLEVVEWHYTSWPLEQQPGGRLFKWALGLLRRVAYSLSPDIAVRTLGRYSLMILTRNRHHE